MAVLRSCSVVAIALWGSSFLWEYFQNAAFACNFVMVRAVFMIRRVWVGDSVANTSRHSRFVFGKPDEFKQMSPKSVAMIARILSRLTRIRSVTAGESEPS